jgi:hypothetical protein
MEERIDEGRREKERSSREHSPVDSAQEAESNRTVKRLQREPRVFTTRTQRRKEESKSRLEKFR